MSPIDRSPPVRWCKLHRFNEIWLPWLTSQSSGSVIDPLNSYLGSLCADGATRCSNETLQNAQTQVDQNCASDVQNAGASDNVVTALLQVFDKYPQVITAACSRNET
jgi:hypothetical protein